MKVCVLAMVKMHTQSGTKLISAKNAIFDPATVCGGSAHPPRTHHPTMEVAGRAHQAKPHQMASDLRSGRH